MQANGISDDEALKSLMEPFIATLRLAPPAPDDKTAVGNAMYSLISKTFQRFVVGVDGSEISEQAMSACLDLQKGKDMINVMHVFDSTKEAEDLDPKYKPDAVKLKFETEMVAKLPKSQYMFSWIDKGGAETADFLTAEVNKLAHTTSSWANPHGFVFMKTCPGRSV